MAGERSGYGIGDGGLPLEEHLFGLGHSSGPADAGLDVLGGRSLSVTTCGLSFRELLVPDPSRDPSLREGKPMTCLDLPREAASATAYGFAADVTAAALGTGTPGLLMRTSSDAILSGWEDTLSEVADSPSSAAIIPADNDPESDDIVTRVDRPTNGKYQLVYLSSEARVTNAYG